jgi:hypothetical protein
MRIIIGALAVLVLAAAVFFFWPHRSGLTEQGVRTTVERFIPLGSSPESTLRVLDSLKVEHSQYGTNRVITANFGASQSKGLVSGAIYVTLYFDTSNHLTRHDVKEYLTGP